MTNYFSDDFITQQMLHTPGGDAECWYFVEAFCLELGLDLKEWCPFSLMPLAGGDSEAKTNTVVDLFCQCSDTPPHNPILKMTVRGGNVFVHINETECMWDPPGGVRRGTIRSIIEAPDGGLNMGPDKDCHIHIKE
ncbi:hypothetical protein LCGC14_2427420 [marine sediment metagenome]|uniref:Uncharacterized protein n=1 Tax=marine sediment metagenome TaxID=412755 RepID=A0A0F9E006_9ZZZZ